MKIEIKNKFHENEINILVGSNNVGKTTLLNSIYKSEDNSNYFNKSFDEKYLIDQKVLGLSERFYNRNDIYEDIKLNNEVQLNFFEVTKVYKEFFKNDAATSYEGMGFNKISNFLLFEYNINKRNESLLIGKLLSVNLEIIDEYNDYKQMKDIILSLINIFKMFWELIEEGFLDWQQFNSELYELSNSKSEINENQNLKNEKLSNIMNWLLFDNCAIDDKINLIKDSLRNLINFSEDIYSQNYTEENIEENIEDFSKIIKIICKIYLDYLGDQENNQLINCLYSYSKMINILERDIFSLNACDFLNSYEPNSLFTQGGKIIEDFYIEIEKNDIFNNITSRLIMIDEVENSFDFNRLYLYKERLEKMSKNKMFPSTVIITTHSPRVVSLFGKKLENIFSLNLSKINSKRVLKKVFNYDDANKILNSTIFMNNTNMEIFFSRKIIIFEGIFDIQYYKFIDANSKNQKFKEYVPIFSCGHKNFSLLSKFIDENYDSYDKVIFVYDNDEKIENIGPKINDEFYERKGNTFRPEKSLSDDKKIAYVTHMNKGIENYIKLIIKQDNKTTQNIIDFLGSDEIEKSFKNKQIFLENPLVLRDSVNLDSFRLWESLSLWPINDEEYASLATEESSKKYYENIFEEGDVEFATINENDNTYKEIDFDNDIKFKIVYSIKRSSN